jgi:O-antigen/teichoic acid export membrane protein
MLLGMAMSQVYSGEAADLMRGTGARLSATGMQSLLSKTIRTALLLGLPLLLMAATAPWVFPLIFGQSWLEAGIYAVPFGVMSFVSFAFIPTGSTVDVLQRQDLHLLREGGRLVLTAGALALSVLLRLQPRIAMIVLSAAGAIGFGFYGLVSVYAIRSAGRLEGERGD